MIVWPDRKWCPCLDSEGKHNGFWYSRAVTAEDRAERLDAEVKLEQARLERLSRD
jgi:hypothetical protein